MRDNQDSNRDESVVEGFGDEWSRFSQVALDPNEKRHLFQDYFDIFPWALVSAQTSVGADIGCGSGRWASLVAPRVAHLHLVDASDKALGVARVNTAHCTNVTYHQASVDRLPFADASMDFAYSLGVLHHVPDTGAAIQSVAKVLKRGAPFLIYLYYNFENRPIWYQWVWLVSDKIRRATSKLPFFPRYLVSQWLACCFYLPIATLCRIGTKLGVNTQNWPLSYYKDKTFYTMRTDALDRFGTRLEQRFSRQEITSMLISSGFTDVRFSDAQPYWCASAIRA